MHITLWLAQWVSDLNGAGLVSELMNVHKGIHFIRKMMDPDFTDKLWSPVLPGDKFNPKIREQSDNDLSDFFLAIFGKSSWFLEILKTLI